MKALLLRDCCVASFGHNRQCCIVDLWQSDRSPRSRRKIPRRSITFQPDQRGFLENSTVCDSAYCGAIQLSSDGGVANGTTGSAAAPAGDSTNYLWGVNGINPLGFNGAEVVFNPAIANAYPNSFNLYWGSIDALTTNPDGTPRYDNTLSVHTLANTVDSVTGSELAAALVFGVNGLGEPDSAPTTISGSIYLTPLGRSSSSRPVRRKTRSSSTWAQACLSRRPGR